MTPDPFTLSRGDMTLVGDEWPGEGAPVLFLHGGGQTRHSWSRTADRLARSGRRVITLDARGHGDSSWDPAGDYSLDAFAGDVLAVITSLDRPPVLVGASLGGITSLLVSGEHPGVAAALVLVDVVVRVEPGGARRIRDFMSAAPGGFATLEEVAEAIAAYTPQRRRSTNLDGLRKNVRQREDGRWYWHWDPVFMANDDEPRRRTDPARLRTAARAVSVPTLIVRGGKSDIVSDAGLAEMLELIPAAEVIDVPNAGHMVAGDDNDVFADGLDAFLETVTPLGHPSAR